MKRLRIVERCALWGLLTLGLCGCTKTSEVRTSEKTAFQEELKGRERDRSTEVVQTGPETITTTVEEFEWSRAPVANRSSASLGVPNPNPKAGDDTVHTAGASGPYPASDVLAVAPILVKRTVTVDQRGPVTATKTEVATKVESASLTEKQEKASDTKKRTSWWPPPWLILAGLVLLGLGGWALKRGVKIASL